jgi:hypothetical protein
MVKDLSQPGWSHLKVLRSSIDSSSTSSSSASASAWVGQGRTHVGHRASHPEPTERARPLTSACALLCCAKCLRISFHEGTTAPQPSIGHLRGSVVVVGPAKQAGQLLGIANAPTGLSSNMGRARSPCVLACFSSCAGTANDFWHTPGGDQYGRQYVSTLPPCFH